VALVRTDVSEEPGASFNRVAKIGELGTTQAATSNRRTLRRATRRNNPEDTILHRPRVFGNKALRGIFGLKRDEATGGWRKLHNEELHNLYFSPSIIRIIKSRRTR
jgi:hypothetical protein